MSIKGQCSNCGWTTKRQLKNMSRPCPKCGGPIYVHEEDRELATIALVVAIVGTILIAALFAAVGVGQQ